MSSLSTVPQSSSMKQMQHAQYTNLISNSLPKEERGHKNATMYADNEVLPSTDALKLPSAFCTAATPSTIAFRSRRLRSSPNIARTAMHVYVIAK